MALLLPREAPVVVRPVDQLRASDAAFDRLGAMNDATLGSAHADLTQRLGTERERPGDRAELASCVLRWRPSLASVTQARLLLADPRSADEERWARVADRFEANAARPVLPVDRLNVVVNNRCPMVCAGCYNDFSSESMSLDLVHRLMSESVRIGIRSWVVSGGDPVLWPHLPEVVRACFDNGLAVGVDTTGVALTHAVAAAIAPWVAYVGIPMDAPEGAEDRFRRHGTSVPHDYAERAAAVARSAGIPVKINTVVHRSNIGHLASIAQRVAAVEPSTWSLFEWNPVRARPALVERMALDEGMFDLAIDALEAGRTGPPIRRGSLADRSFGNAVVQCDGRVLTAGSFSRSQILLGDAVREPLDIVLSSIGYRRRGRKTRPAERFAVADA